MRRPLAAPECAALAKISKALQIYDCCALARGGPAFRQARSCLAIPLLRDSVLRGGRIVARVAGMYRTLA